MMAMFFCSWGLEMRKKEALWAARKDTLGFTFDGVNKTLWLEELMWDAIVMILQD